VPEHVYNTPIAHYVQIEFEQRLNNTFWLLYHGNIWDMVNLWYTGVAMCTTEIL